MASLGTFGTARPATDETFGWFGKEIRVNPDISDFAVLAQITQIVGSGEDDADLTALSGLVGALIHADDVAEFTRLAIANRQTMEDLATLAYGLLEALTGRPTELPSDSSDGQPRTAARSEAASSSRALQLLDDRPDLAVAVVRAQEAKASA